MYEMCVAIARRFSRSEVKDQDHSEVKKIFLCDHYIFVLGGISVKLATNIMVDVVSSFTCCCTFGCTNKKTFICMDDVSRIIILVT